MPPTQNAKPRLTQKERVEESAQRLIDAALALIAEQGFERTTAGEIGQRAGYSRSMVRDRYGSKEALLEALFANEWEARLLPATRRDRTGDGLSRVLGHIDDIITAAENEPEIVRALIVLSFEAPGPLDAVRPWYIEMIRRYETETREAIAAGQADGSIRADLDPAEETEQYVSYGIGLCFRWALERDAYDFVGQARAWRARSERRFAP